MVFCLNRVLAAREQHDANKPCLTCAKDEFLLGLLRLQTGQPQPSNAAIALPAWRVSMTKPGVEIRSKCRELPSGRESERWSRSRGHRFGFYKWIVPPQFLSILMPSGGVAVGRPE